MRGPPVDPVNHLSRLVTATIAPCHASRDDWITGQPSVGRAIRRLPRKSQENLTGVGGKKSPSLFLRMPDLDSAVEGLVDGSG